MVAGGRTARVRVRLPPGRKGNRMTTPATPETRHRCAKCDTLRGYSYRFDSFFCVRCDVWIEPTCADAKCMFCAKRPAKPPKDNHA